MVTTAFIRIWGRLVGAVAWDSDQQLGSFEYDPSFAQSGIELAPLKMPLSQRRRIFSFPKLRSKKDSEWDTFKGLPGLLADALPDKYGNQLLNTWLAKNGRPANSMNPVEQLCFIGTRAMGALEFEPSTLTAGKSTFKIEVDGLVHMARKMLYERETFRTDLSKEEEKAMQHILKIGTSAGGARPKALIAFNEKTGEVRSGQTQVPRGFEHWLIKLDGVSDAQFGESHGYGRVEQAYYLMARDCGIDIMPSQMLEENGRAHFLTKRFDREGNDTRHHIQTWCAMSHVDFNEVTSFSYEQLFQTMRELRLTYPEAEEMFRRMVFNVIAKNCDDHTKNFAFRLKRHERWELCPAYDVCHAYRPDSYWVSQHALSINGKRKNIEKHDLLTVAKSMNIKKAPAITEKINEVVSKWPEYAEEVRLPAAKRDAIKDTLHLF